MSSPVLQAYVDSIDEILGDPSSFFPCSLVHDHLVLHFGMWNVLFNLYPKVAKVKICI